MTSSRASTTTRSVRREIVAGFAAVVLALASVGGYALQRQAQTARTLRLQNRGYLPLSVLLGEVYAGQTVMDTLLERVVLERDRAASRTWISSARRTRRAVVLRARALTDSALHDAVTEEDRALLTNVAAALERVARTYRENERTFGELFEALSNSDTVRTERAHRPLAERERQASDELHSVVRSLTERLDTLAQEAEREQGRTLRVLTVATVLALGVGLATMLSARRALQPLALLISRVRAVAGGDLSPKVVPARPDEIGELAREFEHMVEAVKFRDEELRRAEEHLERVVATLRSAVMVVGSDGRVQSANPSAVAMAGEALEGKRFAETPYERVDGLERLVRSVCDGSTNGEAAVARRWGDRALDVAVVPFEGTRGKGALVVADDVTERERSRERLLQNERLAAIGRMAAHVTHEVRNPLSSIALNAEMLTDEAQSLGEEGREVVRLVRAIQREIDRLTGITEDYLRVARLPRPRLEAENIVELVAEIAAFARPEFTRAGVELRTELKEVPLVRLDEGQLRQALLNLLRNAREAMEKQTNRTKVVLVRVREERKGVALTVSDSGPGLPAELREHLFELFFTTKERGSGLGLALTKELVLAHGGTIEARDATEDEGGGACFVLWFPLEKLS